MMRHLPVPNYHQQQTIFGFPAHEIEAGRGPPKFSGKPNLPKKNITI
jgi:hypothetical protein